MDNDDLEFMSDTDAVNLEKLPLGSHMILWLTILFFSIFIIWANFAEIDEVAHADGRVIPSSSTQVIQNLEGGILAELLTKEGARVFSGQNLMRLDDTRFASSLNEAQLSHHALTALVTRLEAELQDAIYTPPVNFPAQHMSLFERQKSLFIARKFELKSALDILQQQLKQEQQGLAGLLSEAEKLAQNAKLAQQELSLTKPLVKTGAVSQVELLRLQIAVNESVGRLESTRLAIPGAQSVITEAEEKIQERKQQFYLEAQAELNEAKTQLSLLTISKLALADRVDRTHITSPVDGTVKQILVTTIGAVIQPGMDLIEIVPSNDTLLVEAKIRPADIAFIHPGQTATVKLTAYDFAIYGGLDSVLELISADTITDERGEYFFQIRVRTNKKYLGSANNPLPIMPGMIATVDIITGKKSVMDYILKPLKRAQATALSER
ncbi:MAG: HlyD family type I secretion periplasmic adaptor subunit [Pseudomonadales bacterium]|nr:HlyD family type I secretion periplasmic adaptor subunit [Pseudomonadales bacterium]